VVTIADESGGVALRRWILLVALGSFCAGMVSGLALPRLTAWASSDAVGDSPEQAFARELAHRYGLTRDQERSVCLVLLGERQREYEIFRSAETTQLPPQLMQELLAARSRTEQRIRAVLDDEQRVRYDRDSRPDGSGR
jgi:hypothetical protein